LKVSSKRTLQGHPKQTVVEFTDEEQVQQRKIQNGSLALRILIYKGLFDESLPKAVVSVGV
jgi:hypothetical protein